jgi:hypothetical protein
VLLDIGAQSVKHGLSLADPGVVLNVVGTPVSDTDLVTALASYLHGYATTQTSGSSLTVVVATNSDGDFTAYPAATAGADWATKVVNPLQATAGPGITVIGGNDIEAGFAATYAQAVAWEQNYLAQSSTSKLAFVGSADACPATYGVTAGACEAVAVDDGPTTQTWTQANYWALAHGVAVTRIVAMPQIYLPIQAAQWANIAANPKATSRLDFLGALTERGACPGVSASCPSASLAPGQGWAALKLALNGYAVTAATVPTYSTDLRVN